MRICHKEIYVCQTFFAVLLFLVLLLLLSRKGLSKRSSNKRKKIETPRNFSSPFFDRTLESVDPLRCDLWWGLIILLNPSQSIGVCGRIKHSVTPRREAAIAEGGTNFSNLRLPHTRRCRRRWCGSVKVTMRWPTVVIIIIIVVWRRMDVLLAGYSPSSTFDGKVGKW